MGPRSPCLPLDHPLAGCEQKLWRAQQHFDLLTEGIDALWDGEFKPATLRTELKPDAKDTYRTVIESVGAPPVRLATLIGDIVHNLRCSLDYLVYELAFLGLRGKAVPGRTGFPASTTRSNWNDAHVQGTLLAGVMQKHRAMLYRAQPCYRRKDRPTATTLRRRRRHPAVILHDL